MFGSLLASSSKSQIWCIWHPASVALERTRRGTRLDYREFTHCGSRGKARRVAARPCGVDRTDSGGVRMYGLSNSPGSPRAALLLLRSTVEDPGRPDAPFALGALQTSAGSHGLGGGAASRSVPYGNRNEGS
jgi:hypothetical protein